MQYHTLKNTTQISPNNQGTKIRISISESSRIVEQERINKIRFKPLTKEEKIIKFSPPIENSKQ